MPLLPLTMVSLLALVLQQVLASSVSGVQLELTWIVAVFAAMRWPASSSLWLALALGAAVDLSTAYPIGQSGAVGSPQHLSVLGPTALAYLAGAWAVVRWKDWFLRDAVIAVTIMVLLAGLVMHATEVVVLLVRSLPIFAGEFLTGRSLPGELWHRLVSLAGTTLAAVPAAWLLRKLPKSSR